MPKNKYRVSGYLVAKFPFEVTVEDIDAALAKAAAVEKARSDIEKFFNVATEKEACAIHITREK